MQMDVMIVIELSVIMTTQTVAYLFVFHS